jgi:hypothetical protein
VSASKDGKIKGIGIVDIVRALRAERERALRVLRSNLHHYLDERIAISAWYPETDFLGLMEAFMRVQKGATWERAGVLSARAALTSVYRNIVVEHDVPESAHRMRVNWRNYHDTGALSVENLPSLVRVTVEGYCMVSAELCRLNQAYFGEILTLAGALVTEQSKLRCTTSGHSACLWEYVWRDKLASGFDAPRASSAPRT